MKEKNIEKYLIIQNRLLRIIIFILIFIVLIITITPFINIDEQKKNTKIKTKSNKSENYVFVGDSITWMYDLNKYYDKIPVVNSGVDGDISENVLKNIKTRIYDYNPSKVFILIGTNDIIYNYSDDNITKNVEKIIKGIKKNRPNCKIYIESIYPINNTDDDKINHNMVKNRTNSRINNINTELKYICEQSDSTFINIHDLLQDEEGNLNLKYTIEGLHINSEGYKVITNELMKYIK